MVKTRQDQRLILLLYFQDMSFIKLSLFVAWPPLSDFGFLKVGWFAKELYLRLMTDQSILAVIFYRTSHSFIEFDF